MDQFTIYQFARSPEAPTGPINVLHGYTFNEATRFARWGAKALGATHLIVRKCPRS